MTKLITVATIAAILSSTTLAHAEEDWTGFHVGAHLGTSNIDIFSGGLGESDRKTVYGLHAGYDHDFGKFVLGAELEYSIADYEFTGATVDTKTTRLKVRGGYDFGRTLLYGVVSYGDLDLQSSVAASSVSDTGFGFGLGVDFKATDHLVIGLEYFSESFEIKSVDIDPSSLSLRASYRF